MCVMKYLIENRERHGGRCGEMCGVASSGRESTRGTGFLAVAGVAKGDAGETPAAFCTESGAFQGS